MIGKFGWTIISPIIAKWLREKTGLEVKSSYFLKFDHLKDLEIYSKAKKAGKINPAHLLN